MKARSEWPLKIKNGNCAVRIYKYTNRKGDTDYTEYKVASHDLNGKRKLQTFADLGDAKRVAKGIVDSFSGHDVDAMTLKAKDAAVYKRAIESLKPFGVGLDAAASEYAHAKKILGERSLIEAVRYYEKKYPANMPRESVEKVANEFIEAKRKAKKSEDYLRDLKYRCGKFAEAFKLPLMDVTSADIRTWLEGMELSPRSFNNFRRSVGTLFEFAKKRGYLPRDHDEIEAIEMIEDGAGEITIYTPEELAEIISRADPRFVPFVVIGAFAGLRSAEIERLEWSEVNLPEGHIEIKAKKAKTKARRLAPILPNLAEWLAPYAQKAQPSDMVIPFDDFGDQIQNLCAEIKEGEKVVRKAFKWRVNALRHSFCSYRVADTKNVPQVALEAGNSPKMIFENYRQLVTEAAAKTWFSLTPETAAKNIIQMPKPSAQRPEVPTPEQGARSK
jgi:integrase